MDVNDDVRTKQGGLGMVPLIYCHMCNCRFVCFFNASLKNLPVGWLFFMI